MKKLKVILVAIMLVAVAVPSMGTLAEAYDLRVGIGNLPDQLDPQAEVSLTGSRVFYSVFDTLINMNPDNNSILEPQLAVSWERLSDTVLELKLRPDVVFHNGDPFTSEDVKFSFERVLYTEGRFSNARSLLSVITDIETPDPLTVRLITENPDPVLEYRIASLWGSWIVPAEYIKEHGDEHFNRNPVGTGPFKVVEYVPDRVTLEKFDQYWGDTANADRVIYRVIPEASSRITSLVNNEIDIIEPVPSDLVPMVQGYDNVRAVSDEHQLIHLLIYNTANPVMEDKRLRQALNLGIDRELIVEALWTEGASVTRGHQFPDYGPLYLEDRPYTEYDPEKARMLVQESGYNGETIYYDLIPGYYDNDVAAAEIIIEMWRDIGINAEIRFGSSFYENDDFAVHPWSYAMRFPDPVGGLWLLWGQYGSRQTNEHWINVDPRFNELGHELSSTMDIEQRQEIFREMLDIFEEEAPGSVLWRPGISRGVRNNIKWTPYNTHTMDFGASNLEIEN